MPSAAVVAVPPVMVPPPDATANVTVAPGIGFPYWSTTFTAGLTATASLGAAVWLSPTCLVMVFGAPATVVAEKVSGLPFTPVAVAVRVLGPGTVPIVQLPTVATPLALVVVEPPVICPPPLATANVTEMFATGD